MNSQHKHGIGRSNGTCSPKTIRVVMVMIGVCIAGYVIGPPLYWFLSDTFIAAAISSSSSSSSCPPCHCDCTLQPLLSHPNGLNVTPFIDCMEHDPELRDGSERNVTTVLVEELELRETEVHEIQQKADQALLEAKKLTSQYQKEADKCSSGMETCEEAREKAEAALEAQRRVTAMWELRARQKGWKDNLIAASIESVQTALGGGDTTLSVNDF
nr:uncharacterized protein LOC109165329 [Ipomoea batatas]